MVGKVCEVRRALTLNIVDASRLGNRRWEDLKSPASGVGIYKA